MINVTNDANMFHIITSTLMLSSENTIIVITVVNNNYTATVFLVSSVCCISGAWTGMRGTQNGEQHAIWTSMTRAAVTIRAPTCQEAEPMLLNGEPAVFVRQALPIGGACGQLRQAAPDKLRRSCQRWNQIRRLHRTGLQEGGTSHMLQSQASYSTNPSGPLGTTGTLFGIEPNQDAQKKRRWNGTVRAIHSRAQLAFTRACAYPTG